MSKILFLVPTIMNRKELEIKAVETMANQFPESKVLFISNIEDEDFDSYEPKKENIEKYVSGLRYSISKALNTGLEHLTDEDYICFLQSDMFVDKNVVEVCKDIIDDEELNTGVVGIRPHSTFRAYHKLVTKKDSFDVYRVLWSDGLMMWSKKLYEDIGKFDEDYFGDRESQEYCYRAHEAGYSNYYLDVKLSTNKFATHHGQSFSQKTKYDVTEFTRIVARTTARFMDRWRDWEPKQKKFFN